MLLLCLPNLSHDVPPFWIHLFRRRDQERIRTSLTDDSKTFTLSRPIQNLASLLVQHLRGDVGHEHIRHLQGVTVKPAPSQKSLEIFRASTLGPAHITPGNPSASFAQTVPLELPLKDFPPAYEISHAVKQHTAFPMKMIKTEIVTLAGALALAFATQTSQADAVTDWNAHWEQAVFATAQPVPAQARFGSILHAAVFDAVNGIARKYTPYHVWDQAPPGARQEAAAVQAAHTVLSALYPSQATVLDQHLATSLSKIPGHQGDSVSIARGRAWGEYVANQILHWRSTDGWTAPPQPYFGSSEPGVWRSIAVPGSPDGTLPAVVPQLATLEPFFLDTPAHFRPAPPYAPTLGEALASSQYAADLNEVQSIGRVDSAIRTSDQTHLARMWQAIGPIDLNRAARAVLPSGNSLVDNARLFALANMATSDALVTSMESKFAYELWRPHHAIRLADSDGNPATSSDLDWTALILAPRFPEYISNHSCLTAAFMQTLSRLLGDEQIFELRSPNYPNFAWIYSRFSEASDQVKEARIWAGIHYRTSCDVGQQTGNAIADYALEAFLIPLY